MKRYFSIWPSLILLLAAGTAPAFGACMALADAEQAARGFSPRLQAARHDAQALTERASAQKSRLYPTLSLDGTYKYISNVPSVTLPLPGAPSFTLGDHTNFSVGPTASWTAWDFGGTRAAARSLAEQAVAKEYEAAAIERQVVLAARAAYFQVALAEEQVALYTDALKLAEAQYADIKLNAAAGTKSRVDELKSHQEVIARRKQLRQAQADRENACSDLAAVTGQQAPAAGCEPVDTLLERFLRFSTATVHADHPSVRAYRAAAAATNAAEEGARASALPRLQVAARSALEYPNSALRELYTQNSLSAAVSWQFFESGAAGNRVREQEQARQSWEKREEQAMTDLTRDADKARRQVANLRDQAELNAAAVAEAEEVARILYAAYRAGSVAFLEVENANFKALEAKIQAVRTNVQLLMNLAVLASLGE